MCSQTVDANSKKQHRKLTSTPFCLFGVRRQVNTATLYNIYHISGIWETLPRKQVVAIREILIIVNFEANNS